MAEDKDALDILLDKIQSLEARLKEKEKGAEPEKKEDVKKDDIDKAKDDANKKEKDAIDEKLKEKMKKRGLL